MNDTFELHPYFCLERTFNDEPVEILFSTEGYNPNDIIKPHVCVKDQYGYTIIDIRNDYHPDYEEFNWVSKNYDLLIKHWYHEITDEELITALTERSE